MDTASSSHCSVYTCSCSACDSHSTYTCTSCHMASPIAIAQSRKKKNQQQQRKAEENPPAAHCKDSKGLHGGAAAAPLSDPIPEGSKVSSCNHKAVQAAASSVATSLTRSSGSKKSMHSRDGGGSQADTLVRISKLEEALSREREEKRRLAEQISMLAQMQSRVQELLADRLA